MTDGECPWGEATSGIDRKAGLAMSDHSAEPIRCQLTFDELNGLSIEIPAPAVHGVLRLSRLIVVAGLIVASGWLLYRSPAYLRSHELSALTPPIWLLIVAAITWIGTINWMTQLWKAHCREFVRIDGHDLVLSHRGHFFLDRPKRAFSMTNLRNLRYSPARAEAHMNDPTALYAIAFDCDGSTQRFGLGLSEEESRRLIKTIKDSYKIQEDKDEPLPIERL
jgi:hypothetical protein